MEVGRSSRQPVVAEAVVAHISESQQVAAAIEASVVVVVVVVAPHSHTDVEVDSYLERQ